MSISDGIKVLAEPSNKLLVPVATSAGKTLQDIWDLVFGPFNNFVEKKRITREKDIQDFKKELTSEVCSIPEDQLQEPPLSIVGPALDASKYYFEDQELRKMFAKLIAASMDKRASGSVLPCFTEIIKQMIPLDAQNLQCFEENGNLYQMPIVEYISKTKVGYTVLSSYVFLGNPQQQDIPQQAQSISALERLGLVNVSFETYYTNNNYYTPFFEHVYYQALTQHISTDKSIFPHLDIRKGQATLTPIGTAFRKICLPES